MSFDKPNYQRLIEQHWFRWLSHCEFGSDDHRAEAERCTAELTREHFTDVRHRDLFEASQRLIDEGTFPGFCAVQRIVRHGQGIDDTLMDCFFEMPDPFLPGFAHSGMRALTDWLRNEHRQRELMGHIETALDAAGRDDDDRMTVHLEEALQAERPQTTQEHSFRSLMEDSLRRAHGRATEDAPRTRTGFQDLDDKLGPLAPGSLTIIGARPGTGKTSILLAAGLRAAKAHGRFGLVSVEDPADVIGDRLLASEANIFQSFIRDGKLNHDDQQRADRAQANREYDRSRVEFCIGGEVSEVAAALKRLVLKHQCDVVAVDYAQAVRCPSAQDRRNEMRMVAELLKREADRLQVPLLLASQLKRQEGEPSMQDLRDAGELEEKAEVVLLAWNDQQRGRLLRLAKNKRGPAGAGFAIDWDMRTGTVRGIREEA